MNPKTLSLCLFLALLPRQSFAQAMTSFTTIDSHATNDYRASKVVYYGGNRHLFDYDATNRNLRWCAPSGSSCTWQVLDGAGGNSGRTTDNVGSGGVSSAIFGGSLHIFYQQDQCIYEFGCSDMNLREAIYDGSNWTFATIDGDGGANGRTTNFVGESSSATVWGSWLWVSYYDATSGDLRLGWNSGSGWAFQTHDGAGGGGGKIAAEVGQYNSILSTTGYIQIFYSDRTNGDLRHAWWSGSGSWNYATRDGAGGAGTTNDVSWGVSATFLGGVTHLFYSDVTSNALRHAWDYGGWGFAVHDTNAYNPVVTNDGTNAHVFYGAASGSASVLKHSWAQNFQSWSYEIADGDSTSGGRVISTNLQPSSAAASGTVTSVTYRNADNKDIRLSSN